MMLGKSDIDEKCDCGVPQDVMESLGEKRYLVPKGYYGNRYQANRYYVTDWMKLRCQECGNVRTDFHVWGWSPDGSRKPIVPPFGNDKDRQRFADIRNAILEQMK